ncbi:MAG TPA: hypothetical protein VIM12_20705 [Noviherbaspirillum sp.]|jgi:cbb3-type cytochrome oxidase subunit 1|uniref:hypothetical protein n=1 Tax=Noviherbaspirillum sp. TaxID=1926288 RepID=UPI002F951D75
MQTLSPSVPTLSARGVLWLRLAVLYLIVGVGLGIVMGASQNFTLRPVHTHVNLLGWATMALAGVIYSVFPQAGNSRLGRAHFWLANLSLPAMLVGLGLVVSGQRQFTPLLAVAETVAAIGILVFAANLFLNLKAD